MSLRHHVRFLICLLFTAPCLRAQAPAPVQPKPQAPNLTAPLMPLSIQRGASVELVVIGANLADPLGVWTSDSRIKATIPTDANNGKDNARLRVRLEVPREVPMGFHSLRLATSRGMSNFRLFCVDDLPAVTQQETNRNKA